MKQLKATAKPAERGPPPDPARLLAWYDRHARRLPWRVGPKERRLGRRPVAYHVWLSEIMLQQTTVAAVKPFYDDFVRRWPHVADLAAAERDEVMSAWAGLGYYARARRMKACAEIVAGELGGRFPTTAAELEKLPGIGAYTAAAIAAIVNDQPIAVVDGNVERVVARLYAIDTPLPRAKPVIRQRQAALTPPVRAGDYAQAVMDLGATICTPIRPACSRCPWSGACRAYAAGTVEAYPVRAPKPKRPTRFGVAFVATRAGGSILLRRRADAGLLGGMTEVPGTAWHSQSRPATPADRPLQAHWVRVRPDVIHVFTHFRLELAVWHGRVSGRPAAPDGHWWASADGLADEALPSVMKKVLETALPGSTKKRRAV